jgi:hypothetical protein
MRLKLILIVVAFFSTKVIPIAEGAIIYNEPFSYSDGSLTTASGGSWVAHSGAGSTPILVTGGTIGLSQGSGTREDVHRDFGSPLGAGQTLYAGFDISVNSAAAFVSTNEAYVAHYYVNSSTFPSRLILTPSAGIDYTFGLTSTNVPQVTWPSGFTFGTTHRAVLSYSFDTGISQLWIDPTSAASASITFNAPVSAAMTAFAFRQANPTTGSTQTIDNLLVATTFDEANIVPEPGSLVLSAIGLVSLFGWYRRRLA